MKKALTITLFVLSAYAALSQDHPVRISGTVKDINRSTPAPNVQVYLLKDSDTVSTVNTDSSGRFSIDARFSALNEYALLHNFKGREYDKIILQHSGDSMLVSEYMVEMGVFITYEEKFDNSAYFELNETHEYQNFEPEWFYALMKEYPDMCVEFNQLINPEEGQRIAKKRMANFKKVLMMTGCDMDRIRFSENIDILDENLLKLDPRSRIQGLVISMEGDCKPTMN